MAMAKGWSILVVNVMTTLTSLFRSCHGCDPYFCVGRVHGSSHVDVNDPNHYYVCDYDRAQYMTCSAEGLVFDNSVGVCAWPDPSATTPTPFATTGVLVNGYCEDGTGGGGGVSTSTSTTTEHPTSTSSSVREMVNFYQRHPNMESACTINRTITASSSIMCGVTCRQTIGCTDFNFWTEANEFGTFTCHLLTCEDSYMLTSSAQSDFYEWI